MIGKLYDRRIAAACGVAIIAIAIAVLAFAQRGRTAACYSGDRTAPSAVADRALYERAPVVRLTSPVIVEVIQGELLGKRGTVAITGGSLVGITGWATDPVAKVAAPVVLVSVDDQPPVRADTCGERSDVASFTGIPSYRRSGFAARLKLRPGVHRVAFSALAIDGRTLNRDPGEVELRITGPGGVRPATSVVGGFTRLDDVAVPAEVAAGGPFSHPIGTDLRLAGWMVDRTWDAPAAVRSVDVLLDGRVAVRAAYGDARPDVADSMHAPELQNAGFTARILTDGMAPGRHVVTLRVVVADGRTTTFGTPLAVDLTAQPGG